MKLKNLIKFLILVVATMLGDDAIAQTKHAAIITENKQEIQLESFKYILLNKIKIPRQKWYTVPTTGQKVYVIADLNRYLPNLTVSEINSLVVLSHDQVAYGKYRNSYYDNWGIRHPMDVNYYGIIPDFNYFCLSDGIALAKTNCANEQDFLVIEKPIEPAPEPVVEQKTKMVMCLGEITMGKKEYDGDIAIGQFSLSGNFYYRYRDQNWFKLVNNQWVDACQMQDQAQKIIYIEKPIKQIVYIEKPTEKVVYVDRYVQTQQTQVQPVNYVAERRSNWFVNLNYSYNQQAFYPQQQLCQPPQRYQQCYQPQQQYCPPPQRQYYPPQQPYQPQPWQGNGSPSNGGSPVYTGGVSSNGGSTGGYSGGVSNGGSNGGYTGGGYSGPSMGGGTISGVHERIGRGG